MSSFSSKAPSKSLLLPSTRIGMPCSWGLSRRLWSSFLDASSLSWSAASTMYLEKLQKSIYSALLLHNILKRLPPFYAECLLQIATFHGHGCSSFHKCRKMTIRYKNLILNEFLTIKLSKINCLYLATTWCFVLFLYDSIWMAFQKCLWGWVTEKTLNVKKSAKVTSANLNHT